MSKVEQIQEDKNCNKIENINNNKRLFNNKFQKNKNN